jgi:hypothetical protein
LGLKNDDADADALYELALAQMYSATADTANIVSLLRQAIDAGSPHAAYALATWYLHGKDGVVPQDFDEAVKLLERAAAVHHREALYDLAACYSNGEGVEMDKAKAFDLYLQSALYGDDQAVFKVGQAYFYGNGVTEDRHVANIWLDRAHELGTYESEPGTE